MGSGQTGRKPIIAWPEAFVTALLTRNFEQGEPLTDTD